jgi:hypothetical protein
MPLYTNTTAGTVAYTSGTRLTKIVPNDVTIQSDNTLSEQAELTIKLGPNERIAYRYNIFWTTTADGDFKYLVDIPASINFYRNARTGVDPTGAEISVAPITTEGSEVGIAVSGENGYLGLEGVLENGSTADSVKFTWAQNSSHASDTTLLRGSSVEYIRF